MMEKTSKKRPKRQIKKKLLHARITHLEMAHPPKSSLPVPTRPVIAVMRAKNIPVAFYRYLYELVGKPHHWEERRTIPDAALDKLINNPACEINVLYADGCPAGFFEISTAALPEAIELAYFGIGPKHQGMGIGKWFLLTAIQAAWAHKPAKVTVHTNTLDHPSALGIYQKFGFSPVAISEEDVKTWD